MRCKVLVSFLISRVFRDEVEVFATDDKCSVHLSRDDGASKDTPADGHFTSEWTFLV